MSSIGILLQKGMLYLQHILIIIFTLSCNNIMSSICILLQRGMWYIAREKPKTAVRHYGEGLRMIQEGEVL